MGLTVTDKGGKDFEILEAGTHAAVCTQIIDIGPQETNWGEKDKVKLRFEVPAERTSWTDKEGNDHEGPMVIWGTYTASLNDKATLRKHLEAWRGKAFTEVELMVFNLKAVLGQPCMISVIHTEREGKTYANIASIGRMPKGMDVPKAEGELLVFDFDQHTQADLDKLPEWLQGLIGKGKALLAEQRSRATVSTQPEPDVPFDESEIPF